MAAALARRLLGVILILALAAALYQLWRSAPAIIGAAPQPARRVLSDLRLPLEIISAFLILSGAEWAWKRTFGKWLG